MAVAVPRRIDDGSILLKNLPTFVIDSAATKKAFFRYAAFKASGTAMHAIGNVFLTNTIPHPPRRLP